VPGGNPDNLTAGSAIPINTEEEESSVLLNNNQTVVLGGVYKREKSNVVQRIPFLYKIPLLGHFFKNTDRLTQKDELIIFLTPHIIKKPSDI
jgi:type IV pilus assembly protein PilQ